MLAVLRGLLTPASRPSAPVQGGRYVLGGWPDDGEVFELRGDLLVNLTTPGGDLLICGDAVTTPEGRLVEQAGALRPAP